MQFPYRTGGSPRALAPGPDGALRFASPHVRPLAADWDLAWLLPRVHARGADRALTPALALALDVTRRQVLGLRAADAAQPGGRARALALALYDALSADARGPASGLLDWGSGWSKRGTLGVPRALRCPAPMPAAVREACRVLGVPVEEVAAGSLPPPFAALRTGEAQAWDHDLAGRVISLQQLHLIADWLCAGLYGLSPLAAARDVTARVAAAGPLADPAERFAPLRLLLPAHAITLAPGGTFGHEGASYQEDEEQVLRYFGGGRAVARRSEHRPGRWWVELDGGATVGGAVRKVRGARQPREPRGGVDVPAWFGE